MLNQFGLVFTALQTAETHKFDACREHQHIAESCADFLCEFFTANLILGKLNVNRQGRFLLYAGGSRPHQDMAANARLEFTHHFAHC